MNRHEYLQRLARGLKRLPSAKREEILADYESYFVDGTTAGRTDDELTQSLGDPAQVASSLRVDHELQSWRNERGARSAWSALLALTGLLLADGLLLIPWAGAVLCALMLLVVGGFSLIYGLFTLLVIPFDSPLGGLPATLLRALGYFSGGVCAIVVSFLLALALANAFGRLHRLHRRALRRPLDTELKTPTKNEDHA